MWSVGCILGGLLLRRPLFPAVRLSMQLEAILELLGNCSDQDLDAMEGPELALYLEVLTLIKCLIRRNFHTRQQRR
jgi:hypothetical protein